MRTLHLISSIAAFFASGQFAVAQGPWVSQPGPVSAAQGGSQYVALALPTSATVWGWTAENQLRGAMQYRVVVSADDGQTWQTRLVAARAPLGGGGYTGQDVVDACTTNGQHSWVLTKDAGSKALQLLYAADANNFSPLPTPPQEAVRLTFFSATTGLLLAQPTAAQTTWPLYRTTDGGTTWAAVSNPPPRLADELPTYLTTLGNSAWVSTTKGRVLSTTDGGLTWQTAVLPTNGLAARLAFGSPTQGLAVTATGLLATTADAGVTWALQSTTGPLRTEGLVAVPGTGGTYLSFNGLCAGSSCPVRGSAISQDGGATWRELENSIYHTAMAASSPTRLWSGSYHSATLFRATNVVLSTTSRRPAAGLVFPNPSAGVLQLAPVAYARQVRLLDVTGRLCATFELPANSTTLNAAGNRPGFYLLQCWRAGQPEAQQRILLQP